MEHNNNIEAKPDQQAKPGRKTFVKQAFKKDEYKPITQLVTVPNAGSAHWFTHDERGIAHYVDALKEFIGNADQHMFHGRMTPELEATISSTLHLLVAKKLAYAADAETQALHSKTFVPIKKLELLAPTFLKNVAEGFGVFTHEGAEYRMVANALHMFNHMSNALALPDDYQQAVDDQEENILFRINCTQRRWREEAIEHVKTVHNAWARESTALMQVVIGGQNVQCHPFTLSGGFGVARAVYAAQNVVLPEYVEWCLRFGNVVSGINNPEPTQAQRNHLRNIGVQTFNWDETEIRDRLARFVRTIQVRMAPLWKTLFDVTDKITTMDDRGRAWQITTFKEGYLSHPFDLTMGDREVGWMMTLETYIIFKTDMQITSAALTPQEARFKYVETKVKSKDYV